MATKPRLTVNKYIDAKWAIKLQNEATADTVANQAFDEFRERIYNKFIPLYEEANQIENTAKRRARHKKLRGEMQKAIDQFFDQYERVTLNTLSNATVAAKRIQYGLIEKREARKPRAKVKAIQQEEATRELQLGKGTSKADTRRVKYRHKGSRAHLTNRMGIGFDREFKTVGVTATAGQVRRKTGPWVKTIARTMAQGTIADADKQAIRESFEKYRYVAIIDERTTARCESLDGQEFNADDADSVRPPQHFNCRSELQPVVSDKGVDKALERDAKRKFLSWLGEQDDVTQRGVVGRKLFKAYKEGKYEPPPRWRVQEKWAVDKATGLPVVGTAANRERIEVRTKTVDVEFDPSLYSSAGLAL